MVYLYIVLAAFSWSSLDFFRKQCVEKASYAGLIVLMSLGQVLVFSSWSCFESKSLWFDNSYLLWGVLSVLLNVSVSVVFLLAIQKGAFSQTVPFLSLVPVIALFAAIAIGELPKTIQVVGVFLVFLGGLNLSNDQSDSEVNVFVKRYRALTQNKGGIIMILAACIWGILIVVDKQALKFASHQLHGIIISSSMLLIFSVVSFTRAKRSQVETVLGLGVYAVLIPISAGLALTFQFIAIQQIEVSLYEAINRSITAFSSIAIGYFYLKENVTSQQVVSALIMSLGVFAILLG